MDELGFLKQLDKAQQPKWFEHRLKALSKLPRACRHELRALIEKEDRNYVDVVRLNSRFEKAAELFESIDDKQRAKLWDGLFPAMAHHVERAWTTSNERPYLFDYQRLPFRAPGRAPVARLSRARYFLMLCEALRGFDPTPEWLAAWAFHIGGDYRDPHVVSWLLAAVLRGGGEDADDVRSVIVDSINGEHEIGRMGHHAVATLLNSDERSDWEVIGKLLLAAQRQEGLRQSILETVDEANPGAFRYMLGLILEHDLGRFSSVVRSFDVWLGYRWAGGSAKAVHDRIRKLCEFIDDDAIRSEAVAKGEAEDAYLAMWATAFGDADSAVRSAARLAEDDDPARRYAGLLIAARSGLVPEMIDVAASRLLSGEESDERILTFICVLLSQINYRASGYEVSDELFDAVAKIFRQFPAKKKPLKDLIWPWDGFVRERRDAAQALRALASGNPRKLLPFADALEGNDCARVVNELAGIDSYWDHAAGRMKQRKRREMDADEGAFVVRMMTDRRRDVHTAAFRALERSKVTPDEVDLLKGNLHRTSATFRRGAIERLSKLPPKDVLSLGEELLDAKQAKKRVAGLELLEPLGKDKKLGKRVSEVVKQRLGAFSRDPELDAAAKRIVCSPSDAVTLDDCLGLVPPGSRAKPIEPKWKDVARDTRASHACLKSLAELFLEHGETEIEVKRDYVEPGVAGGKAHITSYFPAPHWLSPKAGDDPNAVLERLPLRDVWAEWIAGRGKDLKDADGLELIRAWALVHGWEDSLDKLLPREFSRDTAWELKWAFRNLVAWLPLLAPHDGALALLVQCAENRIAMIKKSKTERALSDAEGRKGKPTLLNDYTAINFFVSISPLRPEDTECVARLGALKLVAMDLGHGVDGPSIDELAAAFDSDLANANDFVWLLLKPRHRDRASSYLDSHDHQRFGPIDAATRLKPQKAIAERPELVEAARSVRDRLIEIELTRGERATLATQPASEIRFAGGADTLFKLVTALANDKIVRQDQWEEPTRAYSFSRLISVTMPLESDTDAHFKRLISEHGVKTRRLLELGMYAPQWAGHVERATGAAGFEDAVWWIHAHTKRSDNWRNQEIREVWAAQIKERTELDAEDLEEGAVDVAWFSRLLAEIGEDAWTEFQKPAKYASNSGGHKRAQLFASAMLGRVQVGELMPRIDNKRNQDAVRTLGLVPLPKNASEANAETLARYARLQEFKRESREFGSQRQASEGRAVEIGMQNLARTAGYRDPRRLQWAMEAKAVADLASGPVSVSREETTVSLSIDEAGAPEFRVVKRGRPLKNVPAKLRKHPEIAELKSRVKDLRRQSSRMRLALEESMCRGDTFTRAELVEFFAHPMLRPMIERLVVISNDEVSKSLVGYPDERGKLLRSHAGDVEPVGKRDVLRLAHSADFLSRGDWHDWQRECFEAERVQPFKQVFRELYPRTQAETGNSEMSRRYAGHQVNPRQALALLKKRQWVFAPEEGCRRVYHDEGLVAELWFQEHFYTPADVDGLTLEGVTFRKKGSDRHQVALADVPDRIFSETMRDLDLVVSVAHAGGVDPEASASTVEMRATLLRETCQLLRLSNVRIDGHHAIVDGTKASYSIHLGSATTKVLPGRMLAIVAVHSQYRGRLFLPFADDDPRTAEVMTKALLLARDHEIKDPFILDQIG